MRCPFCGKHSHADICPFCGMDKRLEARIRHTADACYRLGYRAASCGNYYDAGLYLEKALRYDGRSIQILNLLGLVCWQVGDGGRAVHLWKKSIQVDAREENRAHQYIADVEKRGSQWKAMQESLRLYNEALVQCRSESLDYAVARLKKALSLNKNFVKGELLLALCYIEQHHFKKALSLLEKVQSQDPFHPMIARYRRIITEMAEAGHEDAQELDVQDVSQSISVRSAMKEPDMEEIFGVGRSRRVTLRNWHNVFTQIGMFVLGAVCCLAFLYTLFFPAQVDTLRSDVTSLKAEITSLNTDKETLQTQLLQSQQSLYQADESVKKMEAEIAELEAEIAASKGSVQEGLATAASYYLNGDYEDCAAALQNIVIEDLAEAELNLYDRIREGLAESMGSDVYTEGIEAYNTGEYETAVEKLNQAVEFLEGSEQKYEAMYYLGQSHFMMENYAEAEALMLDFLDEYTEEDDLRALAQQLYYDAEYLS